MVKPAWKIIHVSGLAVNISVSVRVERWQLRKGWSSADLNALLYWRYKLSAVQPYLCGCIAVLLYTLCLMLLPEMGNILIKCI